MMIIVQPWNQWPSDTLPAAVKLVMDEREHEGFSGKCIDPEHIRQVILTQWVESAYPAGVA